MPSGKGMTSNLQDLVGPLPGLTGDGLEGPQPIPRAYDTFYILYRLQQMMGLRAPFQELDAHMAGMHILSSCPAGSFILFSIE